MPTFKCDPPSEISGYPDMVVLNYDDDRTIGTDVMAALEEPLLADSSSDAPQEFFEDYYDEDDEDDEDLIAMQEQSIKWSKCYCLVIGLIVGCFIQFSSLGANFLVTSIYGYDAFFMKEFVAVSLLWCFVTSIMGVCILLFLRSLVVTSFYATTSINEAFEDKEEFIATLIQHMEYHFAIGSLIGVCTSWTITDIIIGMQAHVAHSLVTLFVALIWCRLVLSFWGSKPGSTRRTKKTSVAVDVA